VITQPKSKALQSQLDLGNPVIRLLVLLLSMAMSSGELRSNLGIKHRPTNSRLQKYRLTQKGEKLMALYDQLLNEKQSK
jgi:hypothetical protein